MVTALKGLKVIELARILAGPWCGQVLADLGAEVIKIEHPNGDDTRSWGPPFVERENDHSAAYFHACNRGKQSLSLDLKHTDDLATVKALIAKADVVIENFKVGGLRAYGLDYDSLKSTNPQLIYCSITGFGQTGPMAHLPGYDFMIQGLSGVMDLTGEPEGQPQKMGVAFADIFTGLYSAIAIQAAVIERERTGVGANIDMALFDCMLGVLANQAQNYLASGKVPKRLGNAHPNIVPYQVFNASDGAVIIACGNDRQFAALAAALDRPEWASQFPTNASRVESRALLIGLMSPVLANYSRDSILALCEKAGVPCGPILDVGEALQHPQATHRRMVSKVDGVNILRSPMMINGVPAVAATASPALQKPAKKAQSE